MKLLVAIDGVTNLDDELIERLARDTRKPEAEWRRALVAPSLGRVVLSAQTQREATAIADRLAAAGLVPHVVQQYDVAEAVEQAFEATWAEPQGDGLLFIGPSGEELKVGSSSIRLVVTGGQSAAGARRLFVVLGLRDGPGAVIVRIPGAELGKIVKHAEEPDDVVEAFVDFVHKRAKHAHIERGLERHGAKLSGLDEVGTADLAHAGVVAAWLMRRFPPPKREAGQQPAPFQPAPLPSLDLAVDPRRAAHDPSATLPEEVGEPSAPPPAPLPRVSWRDKLPPTPAERARKRKMLVAAGTVAALLVALIAFNRLRRPDTSEHLLHFHESWTSPYGATFTYAGTYDAGIADVPDLGFIIDVEKGGDTQTVRFGAHEARGERTAVGVPFKLSSWDDTGTQATWIVVLARKP